MKCEHCGKNEATFYYKSNINGKVTEHHLCADCAKEMGYVNDLEKSFTNFSASMFGGFDDLFKVSSAITEVLRSGTMEGCDEMFKDVEVQYQRTVDAIRKLEQG